MANFKQAIKWLKEGKKIRVESWRKDYFIFWDENSLCCRDEKNEVVDIRDWKEDDDWENNEEELIENIENKPVKDRTQKEHLRLIGEKYNGSVRDYLLSVGDFKDVPLEEVFCFAKEIQKLADIYDVPPHIWEMVEKLEKKFIKEERKIIDRAHFENWSLTKTFRELDKVAGIE